MNNTFNKHLHFRKPMNITLIPFYLFLIFFHLHTIAVSDDSTPHSYIPQDNIAIDCGTRSTRMATLDNRTWVGDSPNFFPPQQNQNSESITFNATKSRMSDDIPYQSARLSRSEFTYTIPVNPGQKFIRLHFYPDVYGDFDTSKAFFTVSTPQYTLLKNFSAFLTVHALDQRSIMKEFCLNVEEGEVLSITFSPSSSSGSGSFAFINGIEVVSMPTNLYYSDSTAERDKPKLLGQSNDIYLIQNETAMEMIYRINVGESRIPPAYDTGMFRNWDVDDNYLTVADPSIVPVMPQKYDLIFKRIQPCTAPARVYRNGRSTGNTTDEALLQSYNLTWGFPVDSEFFYLVRLHFCEFVTGIDKESDRVFYIYIANETAEYHADIIMWSGGKYVPVYKDYVVGLLGQGSGKKVNLSIALHVNPDRSQTAYLDAMLNGIEMFKLNDSDGNLAGPNPNPWISPPPPSEEQQTKEEKNNRTAIIGISSGIVSGIFLLSVIGFLIFRRGRKVKNSFSVDGTTKSTKTRCASLPSDLCRYFSLAEMKVATNNFDDLLIIGRGGFGNVYKGYIDNGTTAVAIKRLKPESAQGAHEFKTEIEMLSQLRHLHLVSLIGYCNDEREMMLVYEYMARGTLQEHLYNSDNPPLSWKQRLQICIGAARGLHYLHTGSKHTIIHRDVKSTNILLDEKWEAKVSDFGMSKMGPTSMSKAHVSTVVKGSLGYLDPEYYRRQQLTEKSDVYSFGVVLCEVLCARRPLIRTVDKKQMSLAEWARSCYHNGTLDEIMDKHLKGRIAPECLRKYGEIAVNCLVDNGSERPSMNDVVWGLEFALKLQRSAEENTSLNGELTSEIKGKDERPFFNYSEDEGKFSCSWEHTSELKSGETKTSSSEHSRETNQSIKGMSGAVFSEINNPQAR
ncbi:receptor-like protein kinase FERONIA [Ziziphus jujuba]|uniref:Receptor-like protein kinase FERONIA n=2 Tax=Ziziphus jujuba TaxID=326968 RepID=A0ABM3IF33_ZIZJJ|nr:receptor-like protein kinase FERONIA [Ziziphus jujuba]